MFQEQQDAKSALEYNTKALELDPENLEAQILQGKILLKEKKSDEASTTGAAGSVSDDDSGSGSENPALASRNRILLITDGDISYKRRVTEAISKVRGMGNSEVIFVAEDRDAMRKIQKEKWVTEDMVVPNDVSEILSGICPVKVEQ